MHSAIQRLASISCSVALFTGCSAAVEPSGPGGSNDNRNSEKTGTTSEALNPNCQSPTLLFSGLTGSPFGSIPPVIYYNFSGWCFNGGDTVQVYLIDDTTGTTLTSGSVQAGPDGNSNTWFPGGISGALAEPGPTVNPRYNDRAHLVAIDWPLWAEAVSSCFLLNGNGC